MYIQKLFPGLRRSLTRSCERVFSCVQRFFPCRRPLMIPRASTMRGSCSCAHCDQYLMRTLQKGPFPVSRCEVGHRGTSYQAADRPIILGSALLTKNIMPISRRSFQPWLPWDIFFCLFSLFTTARNPPPLRPPQTTTALFRVLCLVQRVLLEHARDLSIWDKFRPMTIYGQYLKSGLGEVTGP